MRILAIIAIVLLLCPGYAALDPRPRYGSHLEIAATPVTLDPADPGRRRVGALTFLGGVHLSARDAAFGGYSSMLVRGNRVLLLNDIGLWLRFRLGSGMTPTNISYGELPAGPGPGRLREFRDSESLTHDPATGRLWVGFENQNAIWRYSPGFAAAEKGRWPEAIARWPRNGGAEAMVRLTSGWFLILSEYKRAPGGGRAALAFDGDPALRDPRFAFAYVPPPDYAPTDIAELPDGRLLVLNRHFALRSRFKTKLTLIERNAIRPDARIAGHELATLAAPLIHDNFEGLAVTREGDATIVWIVSDDNGPSWWQRTLLLKFRLDLPPAKVPHK